MPTLLLSMVGRPRGRRIGRGSGCHGSTGPRERVHRPASARQRRVALIGVSFRCQVGPMRGRSAEVATPASPTRGGTHRRGSASTAARSGSSRSARSLERLGEPCLDLVDLGDRLLERPLAGADRHHARARRARASAASARPSRAARCPGSRAGGVHRVLRVVAVRLDELGPVDALLPARAEQPLLLAPQVAEVATAGGFESSSGRSARAPSPSSVLRGRSAPRGRRAAAGSSGAPLARAARTCAGCRRRGRGRPGRSGRPRAACARRSARSRRGRRGSRAHARGRPGTPDGST